MFRERENNIVPTKLKTQRYLVSNMVTRNLTWSQRTNVS